MLVAVFEPSWWMSTEARLYATIGHFGADAVSTAQFGQLLQRG